MGSIEEVHDPLDQEWLLVNAIREAFGIARRETTTYADSVRLTQVLAPKLLREDSPLVEVFEPESVKLYRERAAARSKGERRDVTPLEVIDTEIQALEKEVEWSDRERREAIESQLQKLHRVKARLEVSNWTESQVISRDADSIHRELPVSQRGQGYRTYRVSQDRLLRIRVLHPDPPEARSGSDMVYETYWDRRREDGRTDLLVRIVALQYKMWDGNALYTSQHPNLRQQMKKMHEVFCESGLCNPPNTPDSDERYRLPYCCAFLRPTDRVQTRNAWRVSHAWHVPICAIHDDFESTGHGHEILRSKRIRCKALTQDPFQEMYNNSMLGSRWLSPTKLSELYNRIGLFDDLDRIVIHAQEYASASVFGR